MSHIIEIEPVCVEQGSIRLLGETELRLRRFQEETIFFFNSPHSYLFLSAPTGSGKTLTLLAPLLSNVLYNTNYEGVLGIYPTKPLAVDQFESLRSTLEGLSKSVRATSEGVVIFDVSLKIESISNNEQCDQKILEGKIGLVLLTRDKIEDLKKQTGEVTGAGILGQVRRRLLSENVEYLVTITVPEYPYLMLSHMYRSRHDVAKILDLVADGPRIYLTVKDIMSSMNDENLLWQRIKHVYEVIGRLLEGRMAERELAEVASALLPPVVFFDEFHIWSSYELPTAMSLVLLHRLISLTSARRELYKVVFSSATPNQYVFDTLSKIVGSSSIKEVKADPVDCGNGETAKIRGKTIVELYPIATRSFGHPAWIELDDHLPNIVSEKCNEILNSGRAIVFGRRVYAVEESARVFREKTGINPTVVTGTMPSRDFLGKEELVTKRSEGELYVFGNYAIELGVDLQNITYVIVSATSLGELVQRMGRGGRGGKDSKVLVLIPKSYLDSILSRLGGRSELGYSEFISAMSWVMVDEPIIRKLGSKIALESKVGKLRLYLPLATYVFVSILRYKDKPRDLGPVFMEFEKILQATSIDKKFFSWLRKRVSKSPSVLVEVSAFRLSPSVPYVREGSELKEVDGESNPVTLLSNYDVLVDTTNGFKLIVKKPERRRIKDIVTLNIQTPDRSLLDSIHGSIMPSRLFLELIQEMKITRKPIVEVLRNMDIPVHVIYADRVKQTDILEVLRAYGQVIALECGGEIYAYLLPL